MSDRSTRPKVRRLSTSFTIRSTAMLFVAVTPSMAFTIRRTSSSSSSSTTSSSRISWSRSSARAIVSWLLCSAPSGVLISWATPAIRLPSVASFADPTSSACALRSLA